MARQGCALADTEVQRIVMLLASTDMTIGEIAERTSSSRGAIAAINRRLKVRDYSGRRSTWSLTPVFKQQEKTT